MYVYPSTLIIYENEAMSLRILHYLKSKREEKIHNKGDRQRGIRDRREAKKKGMLEAKWTEGNEML